MKYFTFLPKVQETDAVIVYLHGSGYMNPHNVLQERFAAYLAENTHAKVLFPVYPKLPYSNAVKCHAVINNFLGFVLRGSKVVLVGDSSGGALALALAEGNSEVEKAVAISPWLDITLKNPLVAEYAQKDCVLCKERLNHIAVLWSFDSDAESPKLSPINGNYSGKRITVFAGEREMLCPDARAFYEKWKDSADITYFEGKDQPHDYVIMPTPEGRHARRKIAEEIARFLYKRT